MTHGSIFNSNKENIRSVHETEMKYFLNRIDSYFGNHFSQALLAQQQKAAPKEGVEEQAALLTGSISSAQSTTIPSNVTKTVLTVFQLLSCGLQLICAGRCSCDKGGDFNERCDYS